MLLARICPCFSRASRPYKKHTLPTFRPATTPYPHNNVLLNRLSDKYGNAILAPALAGLLALTKNTLLRLLAAARRPDETHPRPFPPIVPTTPSSSPRRRPFSPPLSTQPCPPRHAQPFPPIVPTTPSPSPLHPTPATFSQTKRRAPLNAPLFLKPATCRLFIQPAALQSPPRRLPPPADAPTPP